MKKFLSTFIVICFMAISLCGCESNNIQNGSEQVVNIESSTASSKSDNIQNNSEQVMNIESSTVSSESDTYTKVLPSERLMKEIDEAYYEESLNSSSTTFDIVQRAQKYSKKWEQVADEYYDKLMQYDDIIQLNDHYPSVEDFHNAIYNMKINWETYYETELTNYDTVLETIYGAGTARGPLLGGYEYRMKMSWALKLVDICEQLGIE